MERVEFVLPVAEMHQDEGFCWTIDLPSEIAAGDDSQHHTRSDLQLWQGDQQLGPGHAQHDRIRNVGGGLYSHWEGRLYFSSTSGDVPPARGSVYRVVATKSGRTTANELPAPAGSSSNTLFPRLDALAKELRRVGEHGSTDLLYDPKGDTEQRTKMLEAKVEYLLDELYMAKSQLRRLTAISDQFKDNLAYQIKTFDYQWKHLPYQEDMLSEPAWRPKAAADLCRRLEVDPSWLAGKRVLDCGCGAGRHAWAFSTLGARVTAFDASDNAIADTRRECSAFPDAIIEQRNILQPLPYPTDFDVVWSYGVIHCTGNTYGALANIARHVRPGGIIYFMVYPEPERTNFDSYRYYHEVHVIRQLTHHLSFAEKSEIMKLIAGERRALSWFDAISSEVNDLYTFEEARDMLQALGFVNAKRTAPEESSLNVVAYRSSLGAHPS